MCEAHEPPFEGDLDGLAQVRVQRGSSEEAARRATDAQASVATTATPDPNHEQHNADDREREADVEPGAVSGH